jgi:hypothetical protein
MSARFAVLNAVFLSIGSVAFAADPAVLATGKPTVLVLVTGRPYAVDWAMRRLSETENRSQTLLRPPAFTTKATSATCSSSTPDTLPLSSELPH